MTDWHAHIDHDILAIGVIDDAGQHLPRMQKGVALKETIKHAIAYIAPSIPLRALYSFRETDQ